MNFSEEWRFLWPTSCSSHAPQLLHNASASSTLGPLLFHPLPATLTPLISSQYLSLPSFPPPPSLSLPRFLQTSSSALPTTSTTISSSFLAADSLPSPTPSFAQNHLESLPCPDGRSTLAFSPTGNNLDRVGFVLLMVTDSEICVKGDVALSPKSFGHRILQLAACAAGAGFDGDDCVGFLMASTMYSVHWFKVSFAKCHSDAKKPVLLYIGSSVFKSSAVVHVCWNPHLPEESLVLLENGQLFLFDVNGSRLTGSVARFRGKRLPVSWDERDELAKGGWLSCEFSWHPRIVVVANSNAVYLVDFRFDTCVVSCVLKVELLDPANAVEIGQFVSFSKAGSDGFFYAVASEFRLVLFDIRAPCKPILQWLHSHHYPHYMNVFPLSELRGSLGNDEFNQASEMGFAIVLGSFWTTDFSLFCYGPSLASVKKSVSLNKHVKVSNPFYAWDLPSELSLSGHDCPCSSCLIREELTKEDLPEWVDWQQKKQLVLGFFILDKDVSSLMSKADDDAGFVLIRLMSSGKLESQRYRACWDLPSKVELAHQESLFDAKDFHLCSMDDEKYRFPRTFKYIRLEYLYAHMNGSLTEILFSKFKRLSECVDRSKRSVAPSHEFLANKLMMYGLTESTASLSVSDAIRDIGMPTSIYEVALTMLWTTLPIGILEMGFSNYEECCSVLVDNKKVSLDFAAVTDQNQLPPFNLRKPSERSNKWSKRVQPGNDLVGPVIPLAASLVLKEISENGRSYLEKVNQFSPDTEIVRESQHVLEFSREMCVSHSNIDVSDDYAVSLFKDSEEAWDGSKSKNLLLYKPSSFPDALLDAGDDAGDSYTRNTTMIAKLSIDKPDSDAGSEGSKFFDDLCPIDLKFDDSSEWNVGPKEMHSYSILKKQFKEWQHNFRPYTDFCAQFKG